MSIPEGYTKLGLVGYSDKGEYSAEVTYNKYNVVLHEGSTYVALKDGLTGVTPANDGVNWRYFARGFEAERASEITAIDRYNLTGDTPDPTGASSTEALLQLLIDKHSDEIINKLVSNAGFQSKLMEFLVNNGTTTLEGFGLDARYGKNLQDQITELNSKAIKTMQVTETPTDCNQMFIGSYYLSDLSYANMPPSAPGFLLSFGQSSDRLAHLYLSKSDGLYVRCYTNEGWSDWLHV